MDYRLHWIENGQSESRIFTTGDPAQHTAIVTQLKSGAKVRWIKPGVSQPTALTPPTPPPPQPNLSLSAMPPANPESNLPGDRPHNS